MSNIHQERRKHRTRERERERSDLSKILLLISEWMNERLSQLMNRPREDIELNQRQELQAFDERRCRDRIFSATIQREPSSGSY